ncbi:substrate-binding domain-containing protein [Sulfuriferula sp.]|uniref:substrate-binding domain-containing protein n=1 Tax=Sulfuriferula sp. TaxID=2025307 RepID=UPI002730FC6B|nr:substrate-binding domain-containing protein [Sulfuriferula sp.]MDP2026104.1 substrate-binding domain-containing protein [Sulfuriferula sp.]
MLHFRAIVLFLAGLISASANSAELAASTTIRIGGSGGALATMQILGQAFNKIHPNVSVVIVPSLGSGGGIKAMLAGAIDLAISGRALKDTERAQGALATEYARTPFVFATGMRNSVSAITTHELVKIYTGETRTWPDGKPLRLVLRPENESDMDIVKSLSPKMNQAVKTALAREGMIMAMTDQDSADNLENIPGAIGTTTLAQIISEQRALKPLTLNGATPSLAALAEGTYPYFKPLFMVTRPKPNPVTQAFSSFVRSAEGRQILAKNGQSTTSVK